MELVHFEHDLFLLMLNLTQIKDEKTILSCFSEAIGAFSKDFQIQFCPDKKSGRSCFQIETSRNFFGCFVIEGDLSLIPEPQIALIRNSIRMLAVILENRRQAKLLANDKDRLEALVSDQVEALAQSEEKYRSVFEQAADSILLIEAESEQIVEFNSKAQTVLGFSKEEFHNLKISDLDFEHSQEQVKSHFQQIIRQGFDTYERSIRTKTGEIRDFLINTKTIELQNKLYFSSILSDITNQKKAENEIKEHKVFIQTAINAQRDTFFVFDHLTGKTLEWNLSFERISGYSHEEVASMKAPESYYSKEDIVKANNYIQSLFNGCVGTVELDLIHKDGHHIPTEYSASILKDAEGRPKGIISIGRDISDRKKAENEKMELEKELRQAHKMEAVGTLSGGIAHDFNNILAVILGYTDLLNLDLLDHVRAKKCVNEIQKAGNRAKNLISQILSFSRKAEQRRFPVHISSIMREVLNFLRASIPTTIDIQLNIEPRCENVLILADPTQIHQVIMNLCVNASQAMEENGGIVSIDLTEVSLSANDLKRGSKNKPGSYLALIVKDTGVGVNEEIMDRIFDPFFSTKGVGKGSGMGLAVVHGIVTSHDGLINVESEPGQGSKFKLLFPILEVAADLETENKLSEDLPLPGGIESILVIDDEEILVELTKARLENLGYKVDAMTSSKEALEAFRSNPNSYDLVITDQTMPTMTGEQLTLELLKIRPDIPIIMSTGFSARIDADKALSMGIKAFVMKPVSNRDLAHTVRKVLSAN